jgi:lipoprotein NlpI
MPKSELFLFVSHISEDRASASEIVAELERRGVPCWIAPRDVHPGKSFDEEIAEALENCRAMLLIFSDRCNDSEYIRREVTVAGEVGKVVIPFRIEDVQPRKALRVRLSDLHWIDGFVSRERAIDEVAKIFTPASGREPAAVREVETATVDVSAASAAEEEGPAVAPTGRKDRPAAPAGTRPERHAVETAAVDGAPGGRDRSAFERSRPRHRTILNVGMLVAGMVVVLGLGLAFVMRERLFPTPPAVTETKPQPAQPDKAQPPEPVTPEPKEATASYERGRKHQAAKEYDLAIADYTEAIRLDPKNRDAYFQRGEAHYGKQDYDRAIADYTEAIRLDPKYRDAYFQRGVMYQNGKRDYDRALADYNEVIGLDPNYALAFYDRGQIFQYGKKEFDRAIADYTEAIRLDPKDRDAYFQRGLTYQNGKQEYDLAIADYTEAIRLDPKYARALYNRGVTKQKIGDTAGGDADIASATALDPNVGK